MVEAAVWYVERGLAIYPAKGKKRVTGYKSDSAIKDPKEARRYFERKDCTANIGIVCGPSELVVIDCDERNGGRATFDELCRDIGCGWFRESPVVLTPSGGFHLYFRATGAFIPGGSNALGPGLDVLSGKCGVIAPPSTRLDGRYRWVLGFPEPFKPPPLPSILLERLAPQSPDREPKDKLTGTTLSHRAPLGRTPSHIPRGRRNVTLTSLAGKLIRNIGSISEAELFGQIQVYNENRCEPPLREEEVRTIARSVMSYGGRSVDPMRWLETVGARLTAPAEFRTAQAYAEIAAKCGRSEITPSALYVCRGWGVRRTAYFRAKKSMKQKGCIRLKSRGRQAPLIELVGEILREPR